MDLPRVNEDICHSIDKEFYDEDYWEKAAKHLVADNPVIAATLQSFVNKLPECCQNAAMLGSFVTYRLLESQAEVDRMHKEIPL